MIKWRWFILAGLIALALPLGNTFGVQTTVGAGGELRAALTVTVNNSHNFGLIALSSDPAGCTFYLLQLNNFTTTSGTCTGSAGPGDGRFIFGAQTGKFTITGTPGAIVNLSSVITTCPRAALETNRIALASIDFKRVDDGFQSNANGSALDNMGKMEVFPRASVMIKGDFPLASFNCTRGITVIYP